MALRKQLCLVVFILASVWAFGQATRHVVKEGETLFSIARRHGVKVDAILSKNGIRDPRRVGVGTVLEIPVEVTPEVSNYVVKPGDTYFGIAREHGMSLAELLALNNRTEASILRAGDRLKIAGKAPVAPSTPAPEKPAPNPNAASGSPTWPHRGPMRELEGKLVGVSFAGRPGDSVHSVSSGEVVWIGPYRGYGNVIFVQSAEGYIYVYAGNDDVAVKPGDRVRPGMRLASLGAATYGQAPTLYFIVYKDGKPVRPDEAPRI